MATTRAKFYVQEITSYPGNSHKKIKLGAVYSSDKTSENYAFWEASPNGSIELYITNPAGAAVFEGVKEFYVDFTPVEPPANATATAAP